MQTMVNTEPGKRRDGQTDLSTLQLERRADGQLWLKRDGEGDPWYAAAVEKTKPADGENAEVDGKDAEAVGGDAGDAGKDAEDVGEDAGDAGKGAGDDGKNAEAVGGDAEDAGEDAGDAGKDAAGDGNAKNDGGAEDKAVHGNAKDDKDKGGVDERGVALRIAPCFPWSRAGRYISVRTSGDKEIALIGNLSELAKDTRRLVEQALAEIGFVLEITRVKSIETEIEVRNWVVETRQGPFTFQTKLDEWPDPLDDGNLVLRDVAGNLFLIPDPTTLDAQSRKLLWPFVG